MAKQGIEWLARLSKEDQILFCKNRVNHGYGKGLFGKDTIAQYLLKDFDSLEEFIDAAFDWVKTPEGDKYWSDIANVVTQ